jgi:hypothetical protein
MTAWLTLRILASLPVAAPAAQVRVDGLPARAWSEATIQARVHIQGVAPAQRPVRLSWTVHYADRVVTGEVRSIAVGRPVRTPMKLPTVDRRTTVKAVVQVWRGLTRLAATEQRLNLFPRDALTHLRELCRQSPVGLVEVGPLRRSLLEIVDLPWARLTGPIGVRRFAGRAVFVRVAQPFGRRDPLAGALIEQMEKGLSVVCLGPTPRPFAFGGRGVRAAGGAMRVGRVIASRHPVLSGVRPADLSGWPPDGFVGRGLGLWPEQGNWLVLVDAPNERTPTPLVFEQRDGAGRALYCGAAVVAKIDRDPIAEVLFANLLRWALGRCRAPGRAAMCTDVDGPVHRVLVDVGLVHHEHAQGVLVGDASLLRKPNRVRLAAHLRRPGTVVLFGLTRDSLAALNDVLRSRWERDTRADVPRLAMGGQTPLPVGRHALLAGMRPEDIRLVAEAARPGQGIGAVGDTAHLQALIGRGLAVKLERDGVRIILWQARMAPPVRGAQRRVLAALLTNLGVRLERRD